MSLSIRDPLPSTRAHAPVNVPLTPSVVAHPYRASLVDVDADGGDDADLCYRLAAATGGPVFNGPYPSPPVPPSGAPGGDELKVIQMTDTFDHEHPAGYACQHCIEANKLCTWLRPIDPKDPAELKRAKCNGCFNTRRPGGIKPSQCQSRWKKAKQYWLAQQSQAERVVEVIDLTTSLPTPPASPARAVSNNSSRKRKHTDDTLGEPTQRSRFTKETNVSARSKPKPKPKPKETPEVQPALPPFFRPGQPTILDDAGEWKRRGSVLGNGKWMDERILDWGSKTADENHQHVLEEKKKKRALEAAARSLATPKSETRRRKPTLATPLIAFPVFSLEDNAMATQSRNGMETIEVHDSEEEGEVLVTRDFEAVGSSGVDSTKRMPPIAEMEVQEDDMDASFNDAWAQLDAASSEKGRVDEESASDDEEELSAPAEGVSDAENEKEWDSVF